MELKKCEQCMAHYTGKHTCDGLLKQLTGIYKKQTCTCKIDKESNLTIDKKCYWHGK